MIWNKTIQKRYDELRLQALRSTLSQSEEAELEQIIATLDAEEAGYLMPTIEQMQHEQNEMVRQITLIDNENEELATLINQQTLLIADMQHWLAEFAQRRVKIQNTYARLVGRPLAAS